MNNFFRQFRPIFVYAAIFSFAINLALLVPSIYMLQVFDRVLTSRSNDTLIILSAGAAGVLFVMFLLDVTRSRLLRGAGMLIDQRLGPSVLGELLDRAAGSQNKEESCSLRDAATLRNFMSGNSVVSLMDAPWLPFYIVVIYIFHPLLGIVATIGSLVLLGLTWVNEVASKNAILSMQEATRIANRHLDTSTRNAEVIKAMGMRPAIVAQWQSLNDRVIRLQLASTEVSGWISGIGKFLRQLIQIAMLGAGAYLVIDQNATSGVMMAATIILGRALAPLEGLLSNWKSLVDARAAYHRLSRLIETIPDPADITELPAPKGNLSTEKISFHTRHSEKPIVRDVSLNLASGDSIGIIGPSASGKSSLARLLAGVWQPSTGTVRIDGADVATWPREQLGRYIGYMPQDVELFPGSVADNISRMARAGSAEVIAAAQKAGAHDMILKLPDGYDTRLGEGGTILSGGQRQRIGLARALFGNPTLVILDEPNSSLDADGENALLQAIRQMKAEQVTLILVTHKPALLADIDQIMLLRDGAVELYGPRDAVLAKLIPQLAQNQPARSPAHEG